MNLKNFLLFLFGFCFTSCVSNSSENEDGASLPIGLLFIYDSLVVADNSWLILSDYQPERNWYLFYDYFKGDIIIMDRDGNPVHHMNYKGHGSQGYSEIRGISFLGADRILAYGVWSYHIYTISGDFVKGGNILQKSVVIDPQYDFKALHFFTSDGKLRLLLKGGANDFRDNFHPDYYRLANNATIYDLEADKAIVGAPYPEISPYQKGFFYRASPQLAINAASDKLLAIFHFDPHVYIYRLSDLSFESAVPLRPDFADFAKGIPFSGDRERMKKESFQQAQRSGEYLTIQALNDGYFLTAYQSGLPEDKLAKDMGAYVKAGLDSDRARYVQLFDGYKKVCQDIPLPAGVRGLGIATARDHILLSADIPEDKGISKYYIARIEVKN